MKPVAWLAPGSVRSLPHVEDVDGEAVRRIDEWSDASLVDLARLGYGPAWVVLLRRSAQASAGVSS